MLAAAMAAGPARSWAQQQPTPPPTPGKTPAATDPRPPSLVRSEVAVGLISDDNLFFRPVGSADLVLRVTPLLELHRATPRLATDLRYRFDAERFTDHPDLTTPLARQDAQLEVKLRPNQGTTFSMRGGYQRTHNAGELNLTTGLTSQRLLATRRLAGAELVHDIGPRMVFSTSYDFANDDVQHGTSADSNAVRARLSRQVGARDEVIVSAVGEQVQFHPGARTYSGVGLLGWSRRMTQKTTITLLGGARVTGGKVRPDVDVAVTRKFGQQFDLAARYARTQTIAVGLTELVEVDRVSFRFAYVHRDRWEAVLTSGGFRNVFPGYEVLAYTLEADVSRFLNRHIAIAASYNTTLNDRRVVTPLTFSEQIRRQAIGLGLRVTSWSPR
jgi:hypothetical protein